MFSGELPADSDVIAIRTSIPRFALTAQVHDVPDPALSQALAAEQADLDLSLIQPASMLGRVMHGKARPEPSSCLLAESVHQCFAGVGAQVVQNQMDGIGGGVVLGNFQDEIGKFWRRARGRYLGEMHARFGLDAAEYVRRSAAFVFIVAPSNLPWLHGDRRPRICMKHHRLFVNADHGLVF